MTVNELRKRLNELVKLDNRVGTKDVRVLGFSVIDAEKELVFLSRDFEIDFVKLVVKH